MKTVILDDDPTGTQSASGVPVLLTTSEELLRDALGEHDSVYVLTNSRAIGEADAVELVTRIRRESEAAAASLGQSVQFVLRGDSTLRGHVFPETEAFLTPEAIVVFVPAFPDGGRTTVDGVHYVAVDGVRMRADETEFAEDPVFPFGTAVLVDYVAEKSGRRAYGFTLAELRDDPARLVQLLRTAPAGAVVVPDAETNDDVRAIARAIEAARDAGRTIVVRSAAPLAAALAGVESDGLLATPLVPQRVRTLLVCGSHTAGATAQLALVGERFGPFSVIDTEDALLDPAAEGRRAAEAARPLLESRGIAVVTTERVRSASHNTLQHGEKVMTALTTSVRDLLPDVDVVVSKGGITSADVARLGLGATRAVVIGQVLAGVSVWRLTVADGRSLLYVVVPGNVGGPSTLLDVLTALRVGGEADRDA
ncbi:hypothetical protein DVJ78_09725 [Humibacter sp. BT305]|nr:hypothetical protein DVJ78_09725 [Humibacter sp. BT305]